MKAEIKMFWAKEINRDCINSYLMAYLMLKETCKLWKGKNIKYLHPIAKQMLKNINKGG